MTDIAYGSEYPFNEVSSFYTFCCKLDETHLVAGCWDQGDSGFGTLKVGVVTGDAIAYGSEYTFLGVSAAYYSRAVALDATHFVVCFYDTDEDVAKAIVGTVSNGDEVAFGSLYTFNADVTADIDCTMLDSTHFVVVFKDDGGDDYGIAMVGVVSNVNEIAFGSEYEFNTDNSRFIACTALDSTHFVVCFMDDGGDDYGIGMVGVVSSGDQIAYGSEYEFNSAVTYNMDCSAIDATHFVVCFRDSADSDKGKGMIGTVSSGDQIAYGSEYEFYSPSLLDISCAVLDSSNFVVCFKDQAIDGSGIAKIGAIAGDAISYSDAFPFNAVDTDYIICDMLSATLFVVVFKDDGGDDYGIGMIGDIAPAAAPAKKHTFRLDPKPRRRMTFHPNLKLG